MEYNEPIFGNLACKICFHSWDAFFPDGINSDTVECPKCHKQVPVCFSELDNNKTPEQ